MKRALLSCMACVMAFCLLGINDISALLSSTSEAAGKFSLYNLTDEERFKESATDTLSFNPERGLYSSSKLTLGESGAIKHKINNVSTDNIYTETTASASKLLMLKVDLSEFSGNMNASGVDKNLTPEAVSALANTLNAIKQNDHTVILRFNYDAGHTSEIAGKAKMEPAQTAILSHINSLSDTFKAYASTILAIQVGVYGLWGECYYNTDVNSHPEYYQQTVSAFVAATAGTDITIAVRTPQYYAHYAGIDINSIDDPANITNPADPKYRVTIFNDAYGANASDMGTYINREKETAWLSTQNTHTMFGGEVLVDASAADQTIGEFNNPEYFVNEAYKLHTTYLNREWNGRVAAPGKDQPLFEAWKTLDYYGEKAFQYIEKHLGYRFVLRGCNFIYDLGEDVSPPTFSQTGNTIRLETAISNVGFSNLIRSKRTDIVITSSIGTVIYDSAALPDEDGYQDGSSSVITFDPRTISSQSIAKAKIALTGINLPFKDTYKVYLRVSSGEKLSSGRYYSAVSFANNDIYNNKVQGNLLTTINVPTGNLERSPVAVYSATDNSLTFYNRSESDIPDVGGTFSEKVVTKKYTGFDTATYNSASVVPWYGEINDIKSVTVADVDIAPVSTNYWFNGCANLVSVQLQKLVTKNTTTMVSMFENCSKLTTVNISTWNTSAVTDMTQMFTACASLTKLDLTGWDTSKVVKSSAMFAYCPYLKTIYASSLWNMTQVTSENSQNMFLTWSGILTGGQGTKCIANTSYDATMARIDLPLYPGFLTDLSMYKAFAVYSEDDKSLNFYKRLSVPSAGDQFNGRTVSAVYENIESERYSVASLPWFDIRLQINSVTVVDSGISPISTAWWFYEFKNANSIEVSRLNTAYVDDMKGTFYACFNFDDSVKAYVLDISTWDTSKVKNMSQMFQYTNFLQTIYVSELWNTDYVSDSLDMFECWGAKLTGGKGTQIGVNVKYDVRMARIDEGPTSTRKGFLTDIKTCSVFAVYSDTDDSLCFYKRSSVPAVGETFNGKLVKNIYTGFDNTYYTSVGADGKDSGYDLVPWKNECASIKTAKVVDRGIKPVSTMFWFYGMSNITDIDISKLDTSNTTKIDFMFAWTESLVTIFASDLWSTESVATSSFMFSRNSSDVLTGGKGTKFTSGLTPLDATYARIDEGPTSSTPGLFTDIRFEPYAPPKVGFAVYCDTDKSLNFYKRDTVPAVGETIDGKVVTEVFPNIDNINYSSEAEVPWNASSNRTNITNFNTVDEIAPISIAHWFRSWSILTVDISKLDTSKCTNMEAAFAWSSSITKVYVGEKWDTTPVTNSSYMFAGNTSLVGEDGTSFDGANPTDKTYARVGSEGNPGYFWKVPTVAPTVYTDSMYDIAIDEWGKWGASNGIAGFDNKEITSFDIVNGAKLFNPITWNLPSGYHVEEVWIYKPDNTWLAPEGLYAKIYNRINKSDNDDTHDYGRNKDWVFNRKEFPGTPETALRFAVVIKAGDSCAGCTTP